MLRPEPLPNTLPVTVPFIEVQPYLQEYGEIEEGIPVKSADVGAAQLRQLLEQATANLLDQAKRAAEEGDTRQARAFLVRADALGADAELLKQVETLIEKAEKTPTPTPKPKPRKK